METKLYNQRGEEAGAMNLPDSIFNLEINPELIHRALVAYLGNIRQPLAHAKGRGEVKGGGKKPWRQKGTGRARHGSIRSPIWKGGGVTFGPTKERNFKKKLNKKEKKKALFMSLSSKIKDNKHLVLDNMKFEKGKTKEALEILNILSERFKGYKKTKAKSDSILIVFPKKDEKASRAIRNLSFVGMASSQDINIYNVLSHKYILFLKDAINVLEKNSSR